MTRKLIEQMLAALQSTADSGDYLSSYGEVAAAITAAHAYLAQPESEARTEQLEPQKWVLREVMFGDDGIPLAHREYLAQPEQSEPDKDLIQAWTERDEYHDMADKLAQGIADHFDGDIGEHSSANSPWDRALDLLDSAACSETMRLCQPKAPEPLTDEEIDEITAHCHDGRAYPQDAMMLPILLRRAEARAVLAAQRSKE